MADQTNPVSSPPAARHSRQASTASRVAEISTLLHALEDAAGGSGMTPARPSPVPTKDRYENKLVQVRLGIASSLFAALKQRHPHTAVHCLRVALGCSSWAMYMGLDDESRDVVELAALLHDIGKIGLPDAVLNKPSRLTEDEETLVRHHCTLGSAILAECCGSLRVLDTVRLAHIPFDGVGCEDHLSGVALPLESRMITIVDAFDSMTTEQVFRPTRSRERALQELFECSGHQFDPNLVKQFQEVLSLQQDLLSDRVAARWLYELQRDVDGLPWSSIESLGRGSEDQRKARVATFEAALFEQKLIEAMNDGVLFVDSQSRITLWNKYAEKLTGISRGAAIGRVFAPSLVEMSGHGNRRIHDGMCPVARCIKTNSQIRQRLMILGRQGNLVSIDLHAIPVQSTDGTIHGATVLLLDARREAALAERCEVLHEEATRDPLTRVANRAEFDRVLQLMVETSQESRQPCSLIMLDIDHFKQVNDTYGHQAGDEAIVGVANLLSSTCRSGDLVARYGGEEFVVLCSDCTNADAVRRAEELRKQLQETHFSFLNNGKLTASFGVTELQAGDTCETMLRRADRALLMAKEQGRNQVVQLGNGMEKHKAKGKWWWLGRWTSPVVIETSVWTAVPIDIAIAKLRGFVSDHRAKVVKTHGTIIELEVSSANVSSDRRKNDRTIDFRVEMDFSEERINSQNSAGFACGENANTRITLKIRPRRSAKRRRVDVAERAKMLLQSLKAYLMAKEKTELDAENSVIMVGYGV